MQGDDSSICQTCTTCTELYMYCLVEFSQQAALERLFNYFHLADEVIGRQRGEVAYLGPHEAGFKAPRLPSTSPKPPMSPMSLPQRPRGPIRLYHHFQDLRSAKGAEAEWSCKTMCLGWEWRCHCPPQCQQFHPPACPCIIPAAGSGHSWAFCESGVSKEPPGFLPAPRCLSTAPRAPSLHFCPPPASARSGGLRPPSGASKYGHGGLLMPAPPPSSLGGLF